MSKHLSSHYPPFGSTLPTRSWSDASRFYRYGFNGKEKDSETANDNFPITIGIGARIYDGRLGRWLSLDPLMKKYIDQSPYDFCINSVLLFIDVDGKDIIITVKPPTNGPNATCFQEIGTTKIEGNRAIDLNEHDGPDGVNEETEALLIELGEYDALNIQAGSTKVYDVKISSDGKVSQGNRIEKCKK